MDARVELRSLLSDHARLVVTDDPHRCPHDAVGRVAARLRDTGLVPGDVVALAARAERNAILAFLGALDAGLAVLPFAPRHPARRRRDLLERSHARAVIGTPLDASGLPHLPADALVSADRWAPASPATRRTVVALPDAVTIVETSGSSGSARLVVHRLAAHLASARSAARALALGPADRWLLSLPTHHVGGLAILFRALVSGAQVVLPAPDETTGGAVVRTRPTYVSVVASQLRDLLADAEATRALCACRVVLAGGGPIPVDLRTAALAAGLPLHVSYGSTEAASVIALTREPELVARPNVAGHILEGHRVRVDADGTLRVGGETMCLGVLEDGEIRAETDPDGFLPTRDIGRIDSDRVLHVTGRADLVFISGGENVDPIEIESVLCAHESITEAVVVGVEDERWGRVPVAFLGLRGQSPIDREDIEAHVAERLPRHAHPRAFYALPRGPGIKPDRAALAEAAARGEDVEVV